MSVQDEIRDLRRLLEAQRQEATSLRRAVGANFRSLAQQVRGLNADKRQSLARDLSGRLEPGNLAAPISSSSGHFNRPPTGMSTIDRLRQDQLLTHPAGQAGSVIDPGNDIILLEGNTDPTQGNVGAQAFLYNAWKRAIPNGDFHDPPPDPLSSLNNTDNKLPGWSISDVFEHDDPPPVVDTDPSHGYVMWVADATTGSGGRVDIHYDGPPVAPGIILKSDRIDVRSTSTRNNSLVVVASGSIDVQDPGLNDLEFNVYEYDDSGATTSSLVGGAEFSAPATIEDVTAAAFTGLRSDTQYVKVGVTFAHEHVLSLYEVQLIELGPVVGGADVGDPTNAPWTAIYENGVLTINADTLAITGTHTFVSTDTLWDAKGDLAAGTGANTAAKRTVGADDTILMADSAQATGLKWVASASPSAVGTAAATGTGDTFTRGDHVHAHEAAHIDHDTTWAAKGNLIVGTANDTAAVLTVGANDTLLVADSAQTTGTKWATLATAGVSAVGHGAADHADITRHWFVEAADARLEATDATSLTVLGAAPDKTIVVAMADGATTGCYWTTWVPIDYTSGTIKVRPIWVPGSTDAVSHAVRWSIDVKASINGTDVTAAGTTTAYTGASQAHTANVQMGVESDTDTGVSISNENQTQLIINVRRVGANAADTYVGVVNLLGIRVGYLADQ